MIPAELSVFFKGVLGDQGLECGGADKVVVDSVGFTGARASCGVAYAETEE